LFHPWIPQIKDRVVKLKEAAKAKDIQDYFGKVYAGYDKSLIEEISQAYVTQQNRKHYLSKKFPTMKLGDIELLNDLITDDDIAQYEKESGNEI
jgi:hypothetical protein